MIADHSALLLTLGGIAVFMLGMSLASENLQKIAADRIRDLVTTLAKKPVWGLFLGIALTLMLQSSGATTTLLVGLGSASVITLSQVMSVILGAAIGSTLTIQILSFNIAQFGLPVFTISFFTYFLTRRRTVKNVAAVMMGFGLTFFGLEVISTGTAELRSLDIFQTFIKTLSDNPVYTMLLTAFITAVGSSTVTISLAMALAAHGTITIDDSVYWIFGANIGTTATALIAAAGSGFVGRQVAWAHTFYKTATVLLFLPLAHLGMHYIDQGQPARAVANFNTIYNVLGAIIFFPFLRVGAAVVERLFPPRQDERQYATKFLKNPDWESPSVSIAHAEREALRMADVVTSMIEDALKMFRREDPDLIQDMRRRDDRADLLARELNLYLAHQLDQAPEGMRKQMLRLMYFVTDLEAAADVVDNQLIELAQKKNHLKVNFSDDGWRDLEQIAGAVLQISQMSVACFQTADRDLAAKVIFHKRNVRRLEQKMRESHITRLVKGTPESIMTSSIHLDVLGEYRRIVGLMSNHVYGLLKDADPYGLMPRRE